MFAWEPLVYVWLISILILIVYLFIYIIDERKKIIKKIKEDNIVKITLLLLTISLIYFIITGEDVSPIALIVLIACLIAIHFFGKKEEN